MATYICDRCSKTMASRQSLWNHRQRCKDSKDGLREPLGNGLMVESRIRPRHKEKFVSDIINNVGKPLQKAKDQHSSLPKKEKTKKSTILPKVLSDLLPLKLDVETDSDSESYSEGSDTEDIGFKSDKAEELKAVFRKLYQKIESNAEIYKKLVSVLDELQQMNCLTREECIASKHYIQKKMDIV